MDFVMIVLSILNLCGVVSSTALAIYGIVFGMVVMIGAIAKLKG